jgi:hypothetical protein
MSSVMETCCLSIISEYLTKNVRNKRGTNKNADN